MAISNYIIMSPSISVVVTALVLNIILNIFLKLFWGRFRNSLRWRKPSFGIKNLLSGFTKDRQYEISVVILTVIFAADLLHMHLEKFPFQAQNLGRERFNAL